MSAVIRALRGATTLAEDTEDQVLERVGELMRAMVDRNEVPLDAVVSIFLTATSDVHSCFPARAVREAGFTGIPLLGAQEIDVVGAQPLCVRVMMHCYTERSREQLDHVYLHAASRLRDDPER